MVSITDAGVGGRGGLHNFLPPHMCPDISNNLILRPYLAINRLAVLPWSGVC